MPRDWRIPCHSDAARAVPGVHAPVRARGQLIGDGQIVSPLPAPAGLALRTLALDVVYPPQHSEVSGPVEKFVGCSPRRTADLFRSLDLGDRDSSGFLDSLEPDLVARLKLVESGSVLDNEDHRHCGHVQVLDVGVLERRHGARA